MSDDDDRARQAWAEDERRRRLERMVADLYRELPRLAGIISRLRSCGIDPAELVIVAPARGGGLAGATLLGLPIVEGDVTRPLVALGDLEPTPAPAACPKCGAEGDDPCTVAGLPIARRHHGRGRRQRRG